MPLEAAAVTNRMTPKQDELHRTLSIRYSQIVRKAGDEKKPAAKALITEIRALRPGAVANATDLPMLALCQRRGPGRPSAKPAAPFGFKYCSEGCNDGKPLPTTAFGMDTRRVDKMKSECLVCRRRKQREARVAA